MMFILALGEVRQAGWRHIGLCSVQSSMPMRLAISARRWSRGSHWEIRDSSIVLNALRGSDAKLNRVVVLESGWQNRMEQKSSCGSKFEPGPFILYRNLSLAPLFFIPPLFSKSITGKHREAQGSPRNRYCADWQVFCIWSPC